jgi:hypothetical protein
MRRWNGWGDDTIEVPVGEGALRFLGERLGPGTAPPTPVSRMCARGSRRRACRRIRWWTRRRKCA